FFQLLLGRTPWHWAFVAAAAAIPFVLLVRQWARATPTPRLWAATIMGTLVVNVYVGVYDSILAVIAALLGAVAMPGTLLTPAYRKLIFVSYLVPWITQPIAKAMGIQVYTLVLFAFTIYLVRGSRNETLVPLGTGPSSGL